MRATQRKLRFDILPLTDIFIFLILPVGGEEIGVARFDRRACLPLIQTDPKVVQRSGAERRQPHGFGQP